MTASDIRNVQADGAESVGDEAATTDARPRLPHLNRTDPPAYLQNYLNREAQGGKRHELDGGADLDSSRTDDTPLYLRRFRDRKSGAHPLENPLPEWEGQELGVTLARAQITKTKEIVPEDAEQAGAKVLTQVHIPTNMTL